MTIVMRPYQPGDEKAIIELARMTYAWLDMDEQLWRWRFMDNPSGKGVIELAWSGDVLAGHYAVSPVTMYVRGGRIQSALSLLTMTGADFRGRGIFPELAKRVYARLEASGVEYVFGFPNTQSHATFVDHLDWFDLGEIPVFRTALRGSPLLSEGSLGVSVVTRFDDRFDRLFEIASGRYSAVARRDSAQLNWRYFDRPGASYTGLMVTEGPDVTGYCIAKRYGQEVQVVDLLSLGDDEALALLARAAQNADSAGAFMLGMWLPVREKLHRLLERLGFVNGAPVVYWSARDAVNDTFYPISSSGWHLTMGDSDVF